jgi:hypothetical protein
MRINGGLVTWYNSSQTCPYTLQTVAQRNSNRFEIRQTATQSQTTPHTIKLFAQQPVLSKLFVRVWDPEGYRNSLQYFKIKAYIIE